MKRIIAALITLIVVGGAGLALYRERLQVAYRADRLGLEWQAAKLTEAALKRASSPTGWDAAVFLSNDAMKKLLGGLNGLTLALQDDDLSLKLRAISVKTMPAFLDIQFELQASSPKRGADLTLKVESELVYVGYEESKPGSGVLEFRMIPLDIVPRIAWAGLDFRGGRLASELLTTGLLPKLLAAAPLSVPLQQNLQAEFGGKSTATVDLNKGLGSTLTYELAIPKTEVPWTVGSFFPLIIRNGMWLLASSEKDSYPKPPVPEGDTPEALTHELESIRSTLLRVETPAADMAVWLSSKPLLSMLDRFASQPSAQRTVTVQSTKITGRIAEDNWSDDLLGKGGSFAEFVDDRSLTGQLVVGNMNSNWVPKQGLRVDLDAAAHAEAKVHVHVDPLIGGGVGTTFGLVGDASDNGWLITASLTVSTSNRSDEMVRAASARQALRAAASDLANPAGCDGDSSTEVKLGPFVIDPNKEVVTFFVGIGKFTKEMADRIGHDVSTEKLREWIEDPVGSFKKSTPGQVVDQVIKTITKPVDNYCAHNWCP